MKSYRKEQIGKGDWMGPLLIHAEYAPFCGCFKEVEPVSMVLFPSWKVLELAGRMVFKWLLIAKPEHNRFGQAYLSSIHEKEQKRFAYFRAFAARQNNIKEPITLVLTCHKLNWVRLLEFRSRLNEVRWKE